MILSFSKYQGTGNDFVMIDNRESKHALSISQIVKLCDRKFGIGADGVILINEDSESDFYMDFYNPDGSQSFCGNGSRCAIAFINQLGVKGERFQFRAIDGLHAASLDSNEIKIRMKDVSDVSQLNESTFFIQTGSPHVIALREDVGSLDLLSFARDIRYSEQFEKDGVNVNVAQWLGNGNVLMRTYERGVEDETLSCGTGVTAVALLFGLFHPEQNEVNVETRGGHLRVFFDRNQKVGFENIWLCGPATKVYDGTMNI